MTEANPQPSKGNGTRELVYPEHCCRDSVYKITNSMFESSNMGDSLYDYPNCSILRYTKEKKNCDNVLF